MIPQYFNVIFLAFCASSFMCTDQQVKITNHTNKSLSSTTNLPLVFSTKPSVNRKSLPTKVDHALIVHLIKSQVNPGLISQLHHKLPSSSDYSTNFHFNSLYSPNSAIRSDVDSLSLSCNEGQTYWDKVNNKCVNCSSSCGIDAMVSRNCTRTHDLECQCHKGFYLSLVDKTCKPCIECPSGSGKCGIYSWSVGACIHM